MNYISHVVAVVYNDSRRQSERDIPDLGSFKHGLMSVKSLKVKEMLSRICCVFLALCNSYPVKELCTKKRRNITNEVDTSLLSVSFLRGYLYVIDDNILFHLWFKRINI